MRVRARMFLAWEYRQLAGVTATDRMRSGLWQWEQVNIRKGINGKGIYSTSEGLGGMISLGPSAHLEPKGDLARCLAPMKKLIATSWLKVLGK